MIDRLLLFSMFGGHNLYSPVQGNENSGIVTVLHYFDKKEYSLRIEKVESADRILLEDIVFNPPKTNSIIWPIDVVLLEDTCYEEVGNVGFIFPKKAYPKVNKLRDMVYYPDKLDWRDGKIKRLAINLTKAFLALEEAGYVYRAFDVDSIFYNPDNMDILMNFSISINELRRSVFFLDVKDIKRDFLPPWIERDRDSYYNADIATMRYAFSALLFRLLIGKLPYQGRLSDDVGNLMLENMDDDQVVHDLMVDAYLKQPVFLFDREDESNSIGTFSSEQVFIDRWKELNPDLKEMFLHTFSGKNLTEKSFYSIAQWYKVLSESWGV